MRWGWLGLAFALAPVGCADDTGNAEAGDSTGNGDLGGSSTSGHGQGESTVGAMASTGEAGDSTSGGTTGTTGMTGTTGTTGSTGEGSTGEGTTTGSTSEGSGTTEGGSTSSSSGGAAGCGALDVLFVIDNSLSMEMLQVALAGEMAELVGALDGGLPDATSVHFGVTTTEMGFSAVGNTAGCDATDGDGQPAASYYVTPAVQDTDTPGAQGRLLEVDGLNYYEWETGTGAGESADAVTWLEQAAQPGTAGSNIEMQAAAAGWMADSANDATNAGFLRDDAVLAIYFLSDEPDQSPDVADELLAIVDAAKPSCLAADCALAGGPVNAMCTPLGSLGTFIAGLSVDATVAYGALDSTVIIEATGDFAEAINALCLAE